VQTVWGKLRNGQICSVGQQDCVRAAWHTQCLRASSKKAKTHLKSMHWGLHISLKVYNSRFVGLTACRQEHPNFPAHWERSGHSFINDFQFHWKVSWIFLAIGKLASFLFCLQGHFWKKRGISSFTCQCASRWKLNKKAIVLTTLKHEV